MARLSMVHKIKYGEVPDFLKRCFIPRNEVHSRFTRASVADLSLPSFKSNMGKQSFAYVGATQWNNLDANVKQTMNLRLFKKQIKGNLLERVPQ